jgi:hypothetical protein
MSAPEPAAEAAPKKKKKKKLSGWPLLFAALGVVLFVQALFVVSYVGAFHAPKPNQLRFGIVGASPMPVAVGKQFSLRTIRYSTEADAMSAIDHRAIDGAFVAGPKGATLIVAPAAGNTIASALTNAFSAAAVAFGQKIAIVQVHPLPKGDAGGVVPFLVTMALVVGGYLASTMAMVFGGSATQRRRGLVLAGVALVGSLLCDVIAGPVYGAIPTSKFLALWGLFLLIMLAVTYATAALQTVLGAAGTLIVVVTFVIFGAPAAGGSVPSSFLPTFWRTIGPYLPAGAGTTAVRNTIYFDGNAIGKSLVVLGLYLVVGGLVVLTIRRRRAVDSAEGEAEAEASASAVVVV